MITQKRPYEAQTVRLREAISFNRVLSAAASTTVHSEDKKKKTKIFKDGERGQYLSLEVGIKVITPKGKGIIESVIEDIHPSANVRMEDGTLKNFMHPATEIINGNLEFIWQLK